MVTSWGNYPKSTNVERRFVLSQDQQDLSSGDKLVLPYGCGRSYGDSCLNNDGILLDTRYINHFLGFDECTGILRCESGVKLADIMAFAMPKGWMLPVVPGTQFVSIGGAIANDVHGKNHHQAGTFGCHVLQFELLRSTGERLICSRLENSEMFAATLGGLGLTGLITWAELQLQQVSSPFLGVDTIPFRSIDEFVDLSESSKQTHAYTVAWVDCQARGNRLGRGLFMRANYLDIKSENMRDEPVFRRKTVPCFAPGWLLNRYSMTAFNQLYFSVGKRKKARQVVHYQPFFFPLDRILQWNRIYGRQGFLQYQCVVPFPGGIQAINGLLTQIVDSGQGSFLSVLKTFGEIVSPGMLSFPMPGITLALDFPYRGQQTLDLLHQLDRQLKAVGGRLYPAKDARMTADMFQHGYSQWREFTRFQDIRYSSGLARRVGLCSDSLEK